MDEALEKILKNDPFFKESEKKEDHESEKRMVSHTIHKLMYAACDMYSDDEMGWDEMIDELTKSLSKLKGKESELLKVAKKDIKEDKKKYPMVG